MEFKGFVLLEKENHHSFLAKLTQAFPGNVYVGGGARMMSNSSEWGLIKPAMHG